MAYQQDFLDDQTEQKKQEQSSPEQVISSGSSSYDTSAPTSNTPQKTGSGFTNLSQYVDANKDQASEMAGKVESNLQSGVNDSLSGIENLKSEGQKQAKDNTVLDTGVIGGLKNTPEQFAAKEWQDAYKKQTGGYQGPQDVTALTPYQDVSQKVSNTDTKAKSLNTMNGVGQDLKEIYKNPSRTYTQGENTLDSFLTTSGTGAERLNQARNNYLQQDLPGQFANAQTSINNQLGQAKTTSDQTAANTQNAYNESLNNIKSSFDKNIADANSEKQRVQQEAQLAREQLAAQSPGRFAQAGLTNDAAQYLNSNGYNLGNLVQAPNQFRTAGDLDTDSQIAGYNALLGLNPGAQSEYDFTRSGLSSAPSFQYQNVGAANNAAQFDKEINQRLGQQQQQRDSQYNTILDALDAVKNKSIHSSGDRASVLGLSPANYQAAIDSGVVSNPSDYLSKGANLNAGDVATDSDRAQLTKLLGLFGLDSNKYYDNQDEGNAYNFQSDLLNKNVGDYRKKIADEVAAHNAPIITPHPGQATIPGINDASTIQTDPYQKMEADSSTSSLSPQDIEDIRKWLPTL